MELKIEAYGLGRYMAQHLDESEASLEDLSRAYISGVMHGVEEKQT